MSQEALDVVAYRVQDGIAYLTLDRPEALNAVSPELVDALADRVDRASADPSVRVLLLAGAGRAFCAGADLKDDRTHAGDDLLGYLTPPTMGGLDVLAACHKPVVAAVHGWCVGAGVELLLAADVAIAAPSARFFLPQVELGIVPGAGGIARLSRAVGTTWARRLVLLGERIDAETALRIGLVSEIVAEDALADRARAAAAHLAHQSAAAVLLAKESLNTADDVPLATAVRADQYRVFLLNQTPEKQAAHAAFGDRDRGGRAPS